MKQQFTKQHFDSMLDALEESISDVPKRDVMKKILQLQLERDCAISFSRAFCSSTGDISHIVRGFADFMDSIEE